ncbi:ATP-dependent 6-phosphofructokinase [Gloeothece verrucosa]|uniref:Phosphofructokinase n=1 Tax=Gloeothece verrucosa (strain PCC 7822) TaxID=497965 RepID=E0U9R8_GLOV7|nr:ATP-dependent 6-phosphofructokinase [Gloeothece verrucosa]ADN14988.1 phosphofructokinase [Gloeothece verrucosa PCC 7822]
MTKKKRVGILTSGGDCPGLNAIIRAVVKAANRKNWEVYGLPYGTDGFIHLAKGIRTPEELKLGEHGYDLPGHLQGLDILQFLSGSILGSLSKGNPEDPEVAQTILEGYKLLQLDALIAIGGDGSLDIIYQLAQQGNWNFVGIPKTIDNDVPFTERAVGFDTAVDTVTNALYNLTFTAASHERVMIAQVMGRDAGHLALHAGIAGGADVILIPELAPHLSDMVVDGCCRQIAHIRASGRQFALIVIAEGVRNDHNEKEKYIGDYLAQRIEQHSQKLCETGHKEFCPLSAIDVRVTVLGHLQRSGTPSSSDRLIGTAFGIKAIELIEQEAYSRLVVWQHGGVYSQPLDQVIAVIRQCHRENRCAYPVDPDGFMVQTARSLGIYLGDHNLPLDHIDSKPTVELSI